MKKTFIILILVLGMQSAFASLKLNCELDSSMAGMPTEGTVFVGGWLMSNCEDNEGNRFKLHFVGFGPGLEIVNDSKTKVYCPLASKSRILSGKPLRVVGPKISFSIKNGGHAAIGLNQRGALCTVAGINYDALGASVLIGRMIIEAY